MKCLEQSDRDKIFKDMFLLLMYSLESLAHAVAIQLKVLHKDFLRHHDSYRRHGTQWAPRHQQAPC